MIGETVGNYRILSKLGAGGMGVVYLAEHQLIGRKAAIKVLLPEMSLNQEMVGRFFNEARSTASIKHIGLVDIFDFGHHTNGCAYIAMEFLEGESLAELLKREPRPPIELSCAVVRQVATAVGAAHGKGIVHRDLKPDNIFLVSDEEAATGMRAKVLDFGIAKLAGDAHGGSKTRTGSLMGTPLYMSPEQCRGAGAVDWRSDIYSLGCILYEMVLGRPPFVREGMGEVMGAHMYETPPRPLELDPSLPPWLDGVIMRTLAKNPAERQQSMDELAQELGGRPAMQRRSGAGPHMAGYPTPAPSQRTPYPGGPQTGPGMGMGGRVPTGPAGTVPMTTLSGAAGQTQGGTGAGVTGKSGKGKTLGLVAAAVVVLGGAGIFLATRGSGKKDGDSAANPLLASGEPSPSASTEPPPTASPAASPVVSASPEPSPSPTVAVPVETIKLTLQSTPDRADVILETDGTVLGKTPLDLERPRGPGEVALIIRHAGYRDERVVLSTSADVTRKVKLGKGKTAVAKPGDKPGDKPSPSPSTKPSPSAKPPGGDMPVDPFAN